MWEEARRQEKIIRGVMVDIRKRAERRKGFYEKIRANPTQFLQVHGFPAKINLDYAIVQAAEHPSNMVPWGGDETIIDRFDIRSHLEPIDIATFKSNNQSIMDDRQNMYERYRVLVHLDSLGTEEMKHLQQIRLEEEYPERKLLEDAKKSIKKKNVAIAYDYNEESNTSNSNKNKKKPLKAEAISDEEELESIEDEIQLNGMDSKFDLDNLTLPELQSLGALSSKYGILPVDFIQLAQKEKEDRAISRLSKEMEEEKALFTGKKGRRERKLLKEKWKESRALSPSTIATYHKGRDRSKSYDKNSLEKEKNIENSASSGDERITYITTFQTNTVETDIPKLPFAPSDSLQETKLLLGSIIKEKTSKSSITLKTSASTKPFDKDNKSPSANKKYRKHSSQYSESSKTTHHRHHCHNNNKHSSSTTHRRTEKSPRRSQDRRVMIKSPKRYKGSTSYREEDRKKTDAMRYKKSKLSRSRSRSISTKPKIQNLNNNLQNENPTFKTLTMSVTEKNIKVNEERSSFPTFSEKPVPVFLNNTPSPSSPTPDKRKNDNLSNNSSSDDTNSSNESSDSDSLHNVKERKFSQHTGCKNIFGKNTATNKKPLNAIELMKQQTALLINRRQKADRIMEREKDRKMEKERQEREDNLREMTHKMRRKEREKQLIEAGYDPITIAAKLEEFGRLRERSRSPLFGRNTFRSRSRSRERRSRKRSSSTSSTLS